MSDLEDAIAEVKRLDKISAPKEDEMHFFAVIWRSVASGDLIPRADSEMAVAEAIRRAADIFTERAKQERSHDYAELGNIARSDMRAKAHEADAAAILALAPAEALAEVQRLRAERDGLLRAARDNHEADKRAEKAEAERDAALARVEKLREALQEIADTHNDQWRAGRIARATLDEDTLHAQG